MKVIREGTRVKTIIGDIECLITAISIRGNSVRYEVSYFMKGDYKSVWLTDYEIKTISQVKKKPGFKDYDEPEEVKPLMIEI